LRALVIGDIPAIPWTNLTGVPALPATKAAAASNWLNSYSSATGLFTAAQPAFTDITGVATLAQIPTGYLWSNLGNAGGNLTLANAAFTTEFDQTSNAVWLWKNTTVATALTVNASPLHSFAANYWTGSASAADTWTIGSSMAAGTNGISTLTIAHTGSTGAATVSVPGLLSNPSQYWGGGGGDPAGIGSTGAGGVYIGTGYGTPSAAKFIIGDGTGWQLQFAKRTASVNTTMAYITDQGSISGTNFYISGTQIQASNLLNGTTGTAGSAIVLAGGSPAFTGTPTATTPAASDSSTKVATTAFVKNTTGQTTIGVAGATQGILSLQGTTSSPGTLILGSGSQHGIISGGNYLSSDQYTVMGGVGNPRLGDMTNGWWGDYQDEFAYASQKGATTTFSIAPSSGSASAMFQDDTTTALWNSGVTLPSLQITVDFTTTSAGNIPNRGNGYFNPALTFRSGGTLLNTLQCEFWLITTQSYTVSNIAVAANVLTLTTSVSAANFFNNQQISFTGVGTATWLNVATISNIAIDGSNNLTVTCANNFVVGQTIKLTGLTTATFLEAQIVTIATASTTQFTASFTHALYASAVDTGTAAPFVMVTTVSGATVTCSITAPNYASTADTGTTQVGTGANSWMTAYNTTSAQSVMYGSGGNTGQLWIMGPAGIPCFPDGPVIRKIRYTFGITSPLTNNFSIQRMMCYHATAPTDPWHIHTGGVATGFGSMYGNLQLISNTAATSGTTNTSPSLLFDANYWTGSASAQDQWSLTQSLAAGTNGVSTLTLAHTGSSAGAQLNIPCSINQTGGSFTGVAFILAGATYALGINGRSRIYSPADGTLELTNTAATGFNTLQFFTDTGISRLAANSLAIGNGTVGDFSGSLKLTTLQLAASASAPTSAATAGTAGQMVYFGGLAYLCTVTGAAGSATWSKVNLTAV
jgi:hypothetical protein